MSRTRGEWCGAPVAIALVALIALSVSACHLLSRPPGGSVVSCGPYGGPDCNDLLEIGLDAISLAHGRSEEPAVIAIVDRCPPNARCAPGALGGPEIALIVRWADATIGWATIPLPADFPASPPGPALAQPGPPPAHVLGELGAAMSGG